MKKLKELEQKNLEHGKEIEDVKTKKRKNK